MTASTGSSSQTVSTTFVAAVTGLSVNGYTFTADKGFPQTGFKNASFVVQLSGSSAQNSNYTWASNQAWVSVLDGVVNFNGEPTNSTKNVTITATPKTGGSALTYSFTVKKWFTNGGPAKVTFAEATSFCSGHGVIPMRGNLDANSRGIVGSLVSEWGYLKQGYSTSGFQENFYWTQSPGVTLGNAVVALRYPTIGASSVLEDPNYAVCLSEL
ncbi:hypothetical protein [Enterobacter sp. 262D3]|uniref:hypothetical protein n=1 Tax=Enterobacter sp. 262D3 TaxID=3077763 RepID=UPI002A7F9526|nr:hypothetical protein [Enterobacter sp. 262D3]